MKVPKNSPETAAGSATGNGAVRSRRKKIHLKSVADLDKRTAAYRRTCELIAAVEADLGGADQLSTGERQIVQRAALTGALAEDLEARWLAGEDIDAALYAALGNAQRRLLECLGLSRRARDVSARRDVVAPAIPSLSELLERRG
jgi:hypothetical protein